MHHTPSVPLTLEEHREMGSELRSIRSRMHKLCDLVVEIYKPNNQAAFNFCQAVDAVDRLCAEMQTQAAQDAPDGHTEGIYT